MKLNEQQQAVVDAVQGDSNIAVEAVAGSGKTSTIKAAITALGPVWNVLYLVFNKRNQEEAQAKLPSHCEVKTFNAFGNGKCYALGRGGQIKKDKVKNLYRFEVEDYPKQTQPEKKRINKWTAKISKLISLFRGYALFTWDACLEQLDSICDKHDLELPEDAGFVSALEATWKLTIASKQRDFDDQLFIPMMLGAEMGTYDFVFTDEAQDLNPIKIMMVNAIRGRHTVVGDRHQAIYGFAGADLDAFDSLKAALSAKELPLSYCYRCSQAVIAEAQQIVPQIKAAPNAIEGVVRRVTEYRKEVEPGDFVICRTTAPLVSECLKMIRDGRLAVVLGREVGDSLLSIADDNGITRASSMEDAYEALGKYREHRASKLAHKEDLLQDHLDKCETLDALLERCDTPGHLERVINEVFSQHQEGITYMTAHKSKGLEAKRVFIIRPDLLPHPKVKGPLAAQELNLKYVAVTRAMEELVYVDSR